MECIDNKNRIKFPFTSQKLKLILYHIFQPSHSTVTINPDGKTVKFQVNRDVNPAELHMQKFTYSIGLEPSPGNQLKTSNATCYVIFSYRRNYSSSECQDGRQIGPKPGVTDER